MSRRPGPPIRREPSRGHSELAESDTGQALGCPSASMHRASATSVGGNGATGRPPAAGFRAPAAEWSTLGLRGTHTGSDASHYRTPPLIWLFQPTFPVRGATLGIKDWGLVCHLPRSPPGLQRKGEPSTAELALIHLRRNGSNELSKAHVAALIALSVKLHLIGRSNIVVLQQGITKLTHTHGRRLPRDVNVD